MRREGGSSVVMFVVALPLLLVFLFAVVDLGRTVFLRMAMEDAAHAACSVASDRSPGLASQAQLEQAAFAASPGLKADGLRMSVSVVYGEPERMAYVHRWYDEGAKEFVERPSHAVRRAVDVECVVSGAYLTPLGRALAVAEGESDSRFTFRVQARGVRDETLGGEA